MSTRYLARTALAAMAAASLTGTQAKSDTAATGTARLQALQQSGQLIVDPVFQNALDGGRVLSLVRVELAPGVTEPHHIHPGPEILYGLSGRGFVDIDGTAHPIGAGAVIHVAAGGAKAIGNPTESEALTALAVLVLDPDKPPLSVVGSAGRKQATQPDTAPR